MEPVRVMHLVVGGDIGGAERLLVDLVRHAEATGAAHEVALFTPNPALLAFFQGSGLTVHDRGRVQENPFAYLVRSLGPSDARWLVALLGERRSELLHTHTLGTHVLGTRAARTAGIPQLRTEHHVMHYTDPSSSAFTRWAAARTAKLVAVSDYVHRVIGDAAPALASRLTTIRNGVDASRFTPVARTPKAPFCAAVIGRLTAWKRVDVAIRAAASANVELLVIGDGEERRQLEAVARRSGARVRFTGYVADPTSLLAEVDVVMSTADSEPLGLSVLEALAMERPVVAYRGGGIPEIVSDGKTGLLVDEATAEAFAAALRRVKTMALTQMGREGRAFVVGSCTLGKMAESYGALYRELARRPR